MRFVENMTEEEFRAKREGLDEETLALSSIF